MVNDATNPRVFGSAIHGDDAEGSDLDILVDAVDGRTTLVSLGRIQDAVQVLTGVKVDVLTPLSLPARFRDHVLKEAVSI